MNFILRAIACCLVILATPAAAQLPAFWPLGLASTLQFSSPAVGPANLSGITFDPSGAHMFVSGHSNAWNGEVDSYTVTRDPVTSRVVGISPGTMYTSAPYADGGLEFHGGLLFFTKFSVNQLGQYNPTTNITYNATLPSALLSTGGLTFIPAGYPNAGKILVSSWSHGDIYSITLVPAGAGFFGIGTSTLYAHIPNLGSEGMQFVTSGPLAGHLLVANYSLNRIDAIPIDAVTGLPVGGAAAPTIIPIITAISGPEGITLDPVTGDLFVASYAENKVYRIDGLQTLTALASDRASVSAGAGGTVHFYVRGGTAHANRVFALVATASGTAPGTPLGAVTLPLNPDAITNFVLAYMNTPIFLNFMGTTNATGAAVATFNIPPTPIGVPVGLDFAGAFLNPINLATNAVHLTVVP